MEPTAEQWKEKGNNAFKEKNWQEAKNCFTKAIELNPNSEIYYSNRSASELNMKHFDDALKDAEKAIELKPDWGRAYQRKGAVLIQTGKYEEAIEALKVGLNHETNSSNNNNTIILFQSLITTARKAQKINNIIPRGIIAQVPIIYNKGSSQDIAYDIINHLVDWYTNSNCTSLWAPSPASEITHLSNEECLEFAKKVVDQSRFRAIKISFNIKISSVKEQSSLDELIAQIKNMHAIGSSAVVVSLNAFGKQSDNEEAFRNNIELVNSKIGDIPLGIYEGKSPYFRLFTPNLLKFVANLSNVWFYIDSSSSPSIISDKNSVIRDFSPSFRSFTTSGTFISHCLNLQMDGYCGSASSFLPKIYSWVYDHYQVQSNSDDQEDKNQLNAICSFLSLSEPSIDYLYPFSLKIFLGIHLKNLNVESTSRLPQPEINTSLEENLLRISHLNDATAFVLHSIEQRRRGGGKPADHSVLL